jgi:trehalose/maltose hydrolase-like predicted phosphorylase
LIQQVGLLAIWGYATGDESFIRSQAWPMLEAVADWIASRVEKTQRGYEIQNVTGIDEGIENANNNAYTNMTAVVILRETIAM